ncbi:MAG: hypothetical protein SO232_03810 [Candidatus Onthovivens sp.]|nr:hypothetical protein [Candidatus Onthovivens sp.]MDY4937380.1 hypothetical protein [Candidatus Onthovivens sp.]
MLLATGIIIFDTLFKSHTHFHEHQVSYVENDEEKTKLLLINIFILMMKKIIIINII